MHENVFGIFRIGFGARDGRILVQPRQFLAALRHPNDNLLSFGHVEYIALDRVHQFSQTRLLCRRNEMHRLSGRIVVGQLAVRTFCRIQITNQIALVANVDNVSRYFRIVIAAIVQQIVQRFLHMFSLFDKVLM